MPYTLAETLQNTVEAHRNSAKRCKTMSKLCETMSKFCKTLQYSTSELIKSNRLLNLTAHFTKKEPTPTT